ncbi:MAG TPA: amino acid racemase [Bacteroidia bacterium]|jgi:aspartate racemase|nr:amino acid racemase [Bacteroidia bacterium]
MKTIGLIGGMSWESSALYYQVINRKVREALGGNHSCRCLLLSVDFAEILEMQHTGEWKLLKHKMIGAAQRLEAGGADMVVLCSNTMHKVADEIQRYINIPLIHIVDAAAEEIQRKKLKKLGLLATEFAMEGDFLKNRYQDKFGIEIIIPGKDERKDIHRIIYEESVMGIVNESSKSRLLAIIDNLVKNGAEGIISGCTEIEIIIRQPDIVVELFETTRLHAELAVRLALG